MTVIGYVTRFKDRGLATKDIVGSVALWKVVEKEHAALPRHAEFNAAVLCSINVRIVARDGTRIAEAINEHFQQGGILVSFMSANA